MKITLNLEVNNKTYIRGVDLSEPLASYLDNNYKGSTKFYPAFSECLENIFIDKQYNPRFVEYKAERLVNSLIRTLRKLNVIT